MNMVNKKVVVTFADRRIDTMDTLCDLQKAVQKASLNLQSRYDIRLWGPIPENGKLVLYLQIPEDKVSDFSYGHHLRGIARFLKENCNDRYHDLFVGSRLLNYTEVKEKVEPLVIEPIAATKGYEAITNLIYLLKQTDPESIKRINIILALLDVK